MSASGPPPWDPDDTGAVPVGPEPEPTGAAGGGAGSGGWGGKPKVEPFAIAALVWALVSIVLPLVGTIVALVLSSRAADAIRRSRGTRSGTQIVTAARIIAGAVIVLWAIGLVAFVALGGDDDNNGNKVAVPTQPPNTSTTLLPATTTTTRPPTTTLPPTTTTAAPPPTVITVPPPPTEAPTTQPPPTAPPTTAPPTTAPPTTAPPTTTTSPQEGVTKRVESRIGPSNRGVPADERVVVEYTPGGTLVVTWAINNGAGAPPAGQPTCTSPPPSTTTTTPSSSTTTTSTTTSTTTTTPGSTTTTAPADEGTKIQARREARQILQVIRPDVRSGKLDVTGLQLVGTYPIVGPSTGDVDVVQVWYSKAAIDAPIPPINKMFDAPPATEVQCLNPAFS